MLLDVSWLDNEDDALEKAEDVVIEYFAEKTQGSSR